MKQCTVYDGKGFVNMLFECFSLDAIHMIDINLLGLIG